MEQMVGQNADELWDVLDKDRNKTGELHRRGDALQPGKYHLVVHVAIFNSKGELLMQKRQPWKTGWPNMWDISAAGSALAGDTSRKAAERETKEELGVTIDLSEHMSRFSYFNNNTAFHDWWIIKQDIDMKDIHVQYEEVAEAKWMTREEIRQLVDEKKAIDYWFMDWLFEQGK